MKKLFVLIFLISIILTLSLIGLRNLEENQNNTGKAILIIRTIGSTTQEQIKLDGSTLLTLLKQKHDIKLSGNKLSCIDDICAKKGFWWRFFVNEKLILSSVDKYYPKDGDIILLDYGVET